MAPKKRPRTTSQGKKRSRPRPTRKQDKLEDAKVIVGIDFGTTCSGFAYATMANPDSIHTFYHWPCQGEAGGSKSYCKTQTSLWYPPTKSRMGKPFELQDWGWTAQLNYNTELQSKFEDIKHIGTVERKAKFIAASCGHFLTEFKLCLGSNSHPGMQAGQLPDGFTAEQLISDYLRELSVFIVEELKNKFGKDVQKKDVEWCLTVPTIWTDAAKQTMIDCAQMAGGRRCRDKDASLHPIVLVLEPEAASVYCQQKLKDTVHFRKGSRFPVVDAGGGTVDLVVHQKLDDSGLKMKEVTSSTGDLCGGIFVDMAFIRYLGQKIHCFDQFSTDYPTTVLTIKSLWESYKCSFDGQRSYCLDLPAKLAAAWDAHDKGRRPWGPNTACHDEILITAEDMRSIFDDVVNKILKLIHDQLKQEPKIDAILAVGGFSNPPYLMKRIRDEFSSSIKHIISPPDPGSAVCQGAVAFGAGGPDIMMSRRSRKTYGINMFRDFEEPGDPCDSMVWDSSGETLCMDSFCVFCRIGDEVPVDHSVGGVRVIREGRQIY